MTHTESRRLERSQRQKGTFAAFHPKACGTYCTSNRLGVGKASTPTPGGSFWIREKLKGIGTVYGPLAFGTAAYSNKLTDWPGGGVVGVHGTNEPNLVPGRPSHGCIRMHNKDILKLNRLMKPGTPLLIT